MDKIEQQKAKDTYVEAFARSGIVSPACREAGVSRETIRLWKLADKVFAARCADALEDAIDEAELVVRQRGVEGWTEIVKYKGQTIYKRVPMTGELELDDDFEPIPLTTEVRNDDLLKFYTSANRAKYGAKSKLELSGPEGGAIPVERFIRFIGSDGDGRPDPFDEQHPSEIPGKE